MDEGIRRVGNTQSGCFGREILKEGKEEKETNERSGSLGIKTRMKDVI